MGQLSEAETYEQIPSDWLIDIGISPPFTVEKKQPLMKLALKQLQYYRIHAELQQFRKGMECFGFLDTLRDYKEGLQSLLCQRADKLTFECFKQMFQYNFSPVGSNKRGEEQDTVYAFEVYIQDCFDDGCEINESAVIEFWTGSSELPPLGFEKKLEINFVDVRDRLPVAHTCVMSLELPRGLSPDILKHKMTMAVQWGGYNSI